MGQYGTYTKTGATKQKSYALGIDWMFGSHHLLALYQHSKDGGANNAAAQPSCSALGLGYRYDFSKRTRFQANSAKVNNKVGNLVQLRRRHAQHQKGRIRRDSPPGFRHDLITSSGTARAGVEEPHVRMRPPSTS